MPGISAALERMGRIVDRYMNTDLLDIGRWVLFQLPNGVWREEFKNPHISNIPCHVDFRSMDNPEPNSLDVQPIITSIIIYCNPVIDLQAGDFITSRKIDSKGEIIQVYKGVIGLPQVEQSRKSASMIMSTLGTSEEQTADIEFYSFAINNYPHECEEIIADYKTDKTALSDDKLKRLDKIMATMNSR